MTNTPSAVPNVGYPAVSLTRRFAWAAAVRLTLLTVLLVIILAINVKGKLSLSSHTVQMASVTLLIAFALSALYSWFLRQGKHLDLLVTLQLVFDQAIWTVVVYLSGGATSGATSFYGISCLFGAVLAGFRGAMLAALTACGFYLLLIFGFVTGLVSPPPDQPVQAYVVSGEELVYGAAVNILVMMVVALLAGNLTERLRATGGQLLVAEQRAEQAEREAALGRLAAGLAHEIRNPLGSISGCVRMLANSGSLEEEDRQLCEIIDTEASRLNDLVSDMLDLAKPRQPEKLTLDACSLASEVADLASHTGRGAADVHVVFDGSGEMLVEADGSMLRQMIWNLVRNAVQASSAGSIVKVRAAKVDGVVELRVVDRGDGIDEESKHQLFDAFFTTRSKGTGIGLAVVKRIVDQHGWSIRVEDTPGGGATFIVTVPDVSDESSLVRPSDPRPGWTLFPRTR